MVITYLFHSDYYKYEDVKKLTAEECANLAEKDHKCIVVETGDISIIDEIWNESTFSSFCYLRVFIH